MRNVRPAQAAVTLIELMVVMSIMAVLMGVGLALMTESNKDKGLRTARTAVLGMTRFARTAARNSRAPVSLRVDAEGKWIASVVRKPIGAWHFEDATSSDAPGAFGIGGKLANSKPTDDGRVGKAISFDDSGGSIDCGNVPLLHTKQGLMVEVWYRAKIHKKQRTLVGKKGEFELGLDKLGNLAAYVGQEGDRTELYAKGAPIPEGRWTKICMIWDGAFLTLFVNDTPLARRGGTCVFALTDSPLTIGSKEYPLDGWVDEVRVDALIEDSRYVLPELLKIEGPPEVRFDPSGGLDQDLHSGQVVLTVRGISDSATVTINMLGGSQ